MRRAWSVASSVALSLVAVLGLTACPDDGDPTVVGSGTSTTGVGGDGASTSTTGSVPPDETTVSTDGTGAAVPCPANTAKQSAPAVAPRAELKAVRAAHQPGFDRIVFEFTGTAPGFDVEYVNKPVTQDGSGDEVALRGSHALSVRMENASSWHFDGDSSGPTYDGPKRIRPADTTVVEELVQNGDFEGVLNWALGTKTKAGFRVRQLTNPPRLMVEVCAAP